MSCGQEAMHGTRGLPGTGDQRTVSTSGVTSQRQETAVSARKSGSARTAAAPDCATKGVAVRAAQRSSRPLAGTGSGPWWRKPTCPRLSRVAIPRLEPVGVTDRGAERSRVGKGRQRCSSWESGPELAPAWFPLAVGFRVPAFFSPWKRAQGPKDPACCQNRVPGQNRQPRGQGS